MKLQLLKRKSYVIMILCLVISQSGYAQDKEQIGSIYVLTQEEKGQNNSATLSDYKSFNLMYNQLVQGKETIDLDYGVKESYTLDEIYDLVNDVNDSIGEWVTSYEYLDDGMVAGIRTSSYEIYVYLEGDVFNATTSSPLKVNYLDKESFMQKMQVIQDIIAPVIDKCNAVDSDIQKELIIHDFLITHSEYDYENYLSMTTYGLLVNGKGVCNAYAMATKFLLNLMDIPCDVVIGTARGGAHAWNIVTIDGENYLLDTTWDDSVPDVPNRIRYKYFNIPDDVMERDHIWERQSYPECTSDKYTFLNDAEYITSEGFEHIVFFNNIWYYLSEEEMLYSYNTYTEEKKFISFVFENDIWLDEDNWVLLYTTWDNEQQKLVDKKIDLVSTEVRQSLESYIERFYEECMGRSADEEGKKYWVKELIKENLTGAQLAEQFIHSSEFINKDLTDNEYIEIMYKVFFNRLSDESGTAYWRENLEQGLTRNYVFVGFVNSPEYEALCKSYGITRGSIVYDNILDEKPNMTKFIYRLYQKCMNRGADATGLEYWVKGLVEQSFTGRSVAEYFTNSEEFVSAELSNEAFMEVLYQVFFDRLPDEDGMSYWISRLEDEESRSVILEGFIDSAEYIEICKDYGIVY